MTDAERLRYGAERVRHGWCQDRLWTDAGEVCAVGALIHGTYLRAMHEVAHLVAYVAKAINRVGADDYDSWDHVVNWNNAEGQTAENVAQALELAAVLAEQEQQQEAQPALVGVGV